MKLSGVREAGETTNYVLYDSNARHLWLSLPSKLLKLTLGLIVNNDKEKAQEQLLSYID